jgi:hypothetical protein
MRVRGLWLPPAHKVRALAVRLSGFGRSKGRRCNGSQGSLRWVLWWRQANGSTSVASGVRVLHEPPLRWYACLVCRGESLESSKQAQGSIGWRHRGNAASTQRIPGMVTPLRTASCGAGGTLRCVASAPASKVERGRDLGDRLRSDPAPSSDGLGSAAPG